MIFKLRQLEGIQSGQISLAFRKWKKPAVRRGSLLQTEMGRIEITDISETDIGRISENDAVKAGFDTRSELLKILDSVTEGQLYRIELRYHSPDPRLELRNRTQFSKEESAILRSKLERLDRYSKGGAWTLETLKAIRENPRLKAKYLSEKLGKEKDGFKLNVRKLKNLGLTISHEIGYTLSPMGEKVLQELLEK